MPLALIEALHTYLFCLWLSPTASRCSFPLSSDGPWNVDLRRDLRWSNQWPVTSTPCDVTSRAYGKFCTGFYNLNLPLYSLRWDPKYHLRGVGRVALNSRESKVQRQPKILGKQSLSGVLVRSRAEIVRCHTIWHQDIVGSCVLEVGTWKLTLGNWRSRFTDQ